jgi:hypothetical protein
MLEGQSRCSKLGRQSLKGSFQDGSGSFPSASGRHPSGSGRRPRCSGIAPGSSGERPGGEHGGSRLPVDLGEVYGLTAQSSQPVSRS